MIDGLQIMIYQMCKAAGSPCRYQTLFDDLLGTEGHVIALLVGGSWLIVWV